MKITLDIPEWAVGRNIFIIAGKELLAYTQHTDQGYPPLKIKVDRCNGCGYCCEELGSPFPEKILKPLLDHLQNFSDTGRCPMLGEQGCILGSDIPLGCVISDCSRFEPCTESFKVGGNNSG